MALWLNVMDLQRVGWKGMELRMAVLEKVVGSMTEKLCPVKKNGDDAASPPPHSALGPSYCRMISVVY